MDALVKIGSLASVIAVLVYLVNGSALTPILAAVTLRGVSMVVVSDVLLVSVLILGALAVWYSSDQPPVSKKRAEEIALYHIRRGYLDGSNHEVYCSLTRLEGNLWHVVGGFYDPVPERINVYVDSRNGDVDHASF